MMKDIQTYLTEAIQSISKQGKYVFNTLKTCDTAFGTPEKDPSKLEVGKCYCFTVNKLGYPENFNKSTVYQYLYIICKDKKELNSGYFCISSFEDDLFNLVLINDKDFNEVSTISYSNIKGGDIFGSGESDFDEYSFKKYAKKILNGVHGLSDINEIFDTINNIIENK